MILIVLGLAKACRGSGAPERKPSSRRKSVDIKRGSG